MPRKYPDETKHESIGIRQFHAAVPFTYYAAAVYQRSLHRWRDQLRKKQNGFMSEKTFQSDIKRTQNQFVAVNSAETCQQDATATNVIQTCLLGKPSETAIKLAFIAEKYIPSAESAINGNIFEPYSNHHSADWSALKIRTWGAILFSQLRPNCSA